jgi:hypothetical protein
MTETNGSGRIYWVGGGKGGVGKSMMTVAVLDYLLERKEKVKRSIAAWTSSGANWSRSG